MIDQEISSLAAKLALVGMQLNVMNKAGGARIYELRRGREAWTVSTSHDLKALVAAVHPFPGADVVNGLPNRQRRAEHIMSLLIRAGSRDDLVLAAKCAYCGDRTLNSAGSGRA